MVLTSALYATHYMLHEVECREGWLFNTTVTPNMAYVCVASRLVTDWYALHPHDITDDLQQNISPSCDRRSVVRYIVEALFQAIAFIQRVRHRTRIVSLYVAVKF